jgi:hypothetical protein
LETIALPLSYTRVFFFLEVGTGFEPV